MKQAIMEKLSCIGDETLSIKELRQELGNLNFDEAIISLSDEGKIFLIPDNRSGQLSSSELEMLVRIDEFYFCQIGKS